MKAFRIFIASSGGARNLAMKLSDEINARVEIMRADPSRPTIQIDPVLWWEVFDLGEGTLSALLNECKTCDFAAVLLTEDDVTLKKGIEQLQPRDNCIFEAGLFTGALGLDSERVFLLTSVKKASETLPSDLAGIVYVEIKVSGEENEKKKSIESAVKKMIAAMLRKGLHRRGEIPYIPEEELMRFERLQGEAGQLVPASRIFVHTGQPMEALRPGFAERVQKNIKNEIRYRYFFHADINSLSMIAQLIWKLAAAGVEGETVSDIKLKISQNPNLALTNLEAIYQHLNIHFLLEQPKFELCIHNSEVGDKAVCYLRVPRSDPIKFIRWCEGPPAKDIADSFLAVRKGSKTNSIFRSTSTFDLSQKSDYLDRLCSVITAQFPLSIKDDVSKLCFG